MADLIFEIQSDEIPARMQRAGAEAFLEQLIGQLNAQGITPESHAAYVTPRRLAIDLRNLPDTSPATTETRRGPRVGSPSAAIQGFARSARIDPDQLEIREEKKGAFYFAVIAQPGQEVAEILNRVLPETISTFRWPKSMRWGTGSFRWVRPIRKVTAVLCIDNRVERLDFGISGMTAGSTTSGHAVMSPTRFSFTSFDEYMSLLEERFVILDSQLRLQRIREDGRRLANDRGLKLVEDAELLEEIAGLVEWPVPMIGDIDPKYRCLPREILVTTMRSHQKFLSVCDQETAAVTHFIVVADRQTPDDGATILKGNQLVLNARLADAEFVWSNDLRQITGDRGIDMLREKLATISYHEKLGDMACKSQRLRALAGRIASDLGYDGEMAERAASFVKIDLVSQTVGEFPELQGVVGRRWAEILSMDSAIAAACEEHYLPALAEDKMPQEEVSIAVGLADRIDQLAGFFAIGDVPTGSKDPFALRRAALAIVRVVLANDLRLRMADIFDVALDGYAEQGLSGLTKSRPNRHVVVGSVMTFIMDRLAVFLRTQGLRHDIIRACAAKEDSDDLTLLTVRARALSMFLTTADGERLLHGFRRAYNILQSEGRVAKIPPEPTAKRATAPSEVALFTALEDTNHAITMDLGEENYAGAMKAMASLSEPIDHFFEQVRVNTDDVDLRENRLRLLAAICHSTNAIADLTRIES